MYLIVLCLETYVFLSLRRIWKAELNHKCFNLFNLTLDGAASRIYFNLVNKFIYKIKKVQLPRELYFYLFFARL